MAAPAKVVAAITRLARLLRLTPKKAEQFRRAREKVFGLVYQIAIGFVVAMLVASAVIFLVTTSFLKRTCDAHFLPSGLLRAVAIVELFAAARLTMPETRIWGIITTAGIALAAVVVLITNNKLIWSLPALMALGALVPLAMAR